MAHVTSLEQLGPSPLDTIIAVQTFSTVYLLKDVTAINSTAANSDESTPTTSDSAQTSPLPSHGIVLKRLHRAKSKQHDGTEAEPIGGLAALWHNECRMLRILSTKNEHQQLVKKRLPSFYFGFSAPGDTSPDGAEATAKDNTQKDGPSSSSYFIGMDYLRGCQLQKLFYATPFLSMTFIRDVVRQLIVILQYLHEEVGVVFRDLKLSNVLVDEEGVVKLVDFGLAHSIAEDGLCVVGSTGSSAAPPPVGTKHVRAPEQHYSPSGNNNQVASSSTSSSYGFSCDFWALGVLCHELTFKGIPPFGSYAVSSEVFLPGKEGTGTGEALPPTVDAVMNDAVEGRQAREERRARAKQSGASFAGFGGGAATTAGDADGKSLEEIQLDQLEDFIRTLLSVNPSDRFECQWSKVKGHPWVSVGSGGTWELQDSYRSVEPYVEEVEDQLIGL